MIRSMHVQNFQSHEDSTLEFCPGVNVIVGTSDSGKTALLRSLNWVVNNRPLGTAYIRIGTSRAKVTVVIDPHYGGGQSAELPEAGLAGELTVLRERSTSRNRYEVNGIAYNAPARDVPPEVTQAFGMSELNMQAQLDQPFLILESPGEIASWVNRVTKLDAVDDLILDLARNLEKWRTTAEGLKDRAFRLDFRLCGSEFINLDMYEGLVVRFEEKSEVKDSIEELLDAMSSVIARIDDVDTYLTGVRLPVGIDKKAAGLLDDAEAMMKVRADLVVEENRLIDAVQDLKRLDKGLVAIHVPEGLAEELVELEAKHTKLFSSRKQVQDEANGIEVTVDALKSTVKQLGLMRMPKGIEEEAAHLSDQVRVLANSRMSLSQQVEALSNSIQDLHGVLGVMDRHTQGLDELRVEYKAVLGRLTNCPLCRTTLDTDMKALVLEGMLS